MNSLNKYSVPLPGNGTRGPMKMPKRRDTWRVLFFGFGASSDDGNFVALDANTVKIPEISHEPVSIHSYNSTAHYKGRYSIGTSELSFRDTIGNNSIKALMNQMRKEFNYYSQESRTSASQYKFDVYIQLLDGSNSDASTNVFQGTLNTWVLQSCFITDSNFGDLDYSSSDPQNVSVTIQPDGVFLLGPDGEPLGEEVAGSGSPDTAESAMSSFVNVDSASITDSNFYKQ